jgi:hypothetical protein
MYTGVDKYVKEVPMSKMASILVGTVDIPTMICSMVPRYASMCFLGDDKKKDGFKFFPFSLLTFAKGEKNLEPLITMSPMIHHEQICFLLALLPILESLNNNLFLQFPYICKLNKRVWFKT